VAAGSWAISGPLRTATSGQPQSLTSAQERATVRLMVQRPRPSKLVMRVRFSSPAPSKGPSRRAFLCGRHAHRPGQYGSGQLRGPLVTGAHRPSPELQHFPLCSGQDVRPLTAGLHDVRHGISRHIPARLSSSWTVPRPTITLLLWTRSRRGTVARQAGATLLAGVRERMLSAAAGNPLALMALPAALEAIQLAEATLLPESLPVAAWLERAFAAPVSELPALDPGLPS
jgi:hypothetical protein